MTWLLMLAIALSAISWFYLRGENLKPYDEPRQPPLYDPPGASAAHSQVIASLGGIAKQTDGAPRSKRLAIMRDYMDDFGREVAFDGDILAWDDGIVKGEWLVAKGADSSRRMLYIHGGAWVMGSPLSHRNITTRMAALIGGAVFSLDYSLQPEQSRRQGIVDCQNAYRMLLNTGPDGTAAPSHLYIAGDSAGGNLALSLSSWIRDQKLRRPDAVIALSPATDMTLASPSMRNNIASDAMLGPQFGKLMRIPLVILWWVSWATNRIAPGNPIVSPAFNDLSRLPPTLVQASESEMLLDDARRYVNKACAHGSPVTLQTWGHMVHVWQFFAGTLPEANQAFDEIHTFLLREGALPPPS